MKTKEGENPMSDDFRPCATIILPMYNEGGHIAENLMSVLKTLRTLTCNWELLVIDDGSTDNSCQKAEEALQGIKNARVISYQPNRGRGYALRMGFAEAKGEYIITTESDLSWGAEVIPKLLEPLLNKEADVVIASVHLREGSLINVPFKRRFLSRYGNKILTFGLPSNITMISGMTRGYRREILDNIILGEDGKELHLEIISKLIAIGAKIKEVPGTITWEKKDTMDKKRKSSFKGKKLITSHSYYSLVESPFHFIGLLGLIFIGFGFIGILALVVLKIVGFSLLRIPYFPHYVFVFIVVGLIVTIFSLISSQIRDLKRELIRTYAQISKFNNATKVNEKKNESKNWR
jgi:glycosyltransferase involved in cell wall biosynthesis